MPTTNTPTLKCRDCHHPEEVHDVNRRGECACGCVRLVPVDRAAREARKRTWVVEVRMFVRNRWIETGEFRVRAMAASGAAALAVRQARREHLRPYTRVARIEVTILTVTRG
jgi:hypothetical protein